ncbi:MAG: S8 family serine peptidase [Pseudomonadota bacterium]|nr:S8 family serine peptidase [Pseudomonadota bacterium]
MKKMRCFILSLALVGAGCSKSHEKYQDPRGIDLDKSENRKYLIGLKPFTGTLSQNEIGEDAKVEQVSENLISVEYSASAKIQKSLNKLVQAENVDYIEPNYRVYAIGTPNDPSISRQWAHKVVQSAQAWDITEGLESTIIAVVDTGVDYNHQDLKNNIWQNPADPINGKDDDGNGIIDDNHGVDYYNRDGDPMDDGSHGTHVSGTIAAEANNGVGGAGQAPKVKIMALKFLGGTDGGGDVDNAVRAIDYAIAKKVRIMSNSWGSTQRSESLARAINRAEQAGIIFIAAAGNNSQNSDQQPAYPAAFANANIVSVAATDSGDRLANFSNYGMTSVDIGAPGVGIYSSVPNDGYQEMQGTSMATPLVAGVVALMLAVKPEATVCELKKALLESADKVSSLQGRILSGARVNAYKAVEAVKTVSGCGADTGTNAQTPLLNGATDITINDPNSAVTFSFDVSEFAGQGAIGAYVEISQANQEFSNPNGNQPDPNRLTYGNFNTLNSTFQFIPGRTVPNWGVYSFRVIPLNQQRLGVAGFSNSAKMRLQQR